ncbi:MAG: hypothetical protein ACI8UO_003535 [Verrucomicrobiales bacterium]|jgi:hypothetical protein
MKALARKRLAEIEANRIALGGEARTDDASKQAQWLK